MFGQPLLRLSLGLRDGCFSLRYSAKAFVVIPCKPIAVWTIHVVTMFDHFLQRIEHLRRFENLKWALASLISVFIVFHNQLPTISWLNQRDCHL